MGKRNRQSLFMELRLNRRNGRFLDRSDYGVPKAKQQHTAEKQAYQKSN
jgi:hypothetical protein